MSRSRRKRGVPKERLPTPETPPATARDGWVVVQITNAAISAIIGEAEKLGLRGDRWDPDTLYPLIAAVIARALRGTPDWWANRAGEDSR